MMELHIAASQVPRRLKVSMDVGKGEGTGKRTRRKRIKLEMEAQEGARGGPARCQSKLVGYVVASRGMDSAVTDSLSLELHAGVSSSLPWAVCELAVVLQSHTTFTS